MPWNDRGLHNSPSQYAERWDERQIARGVAPFFRVPLRQRRRRPRPVPMPETMLMLFLSLRRKNKICLNIFVPLASIKGFCGKRV